MATIIVTPTPSTIYQNSLKSFGQQELFNQVGYLPDGTSMNTDGNFTNHPKPSRCIGPDPHMAGSELPQAVFVNSVVTSRIARP